MSSFGPLKTNCVSHSCAVLRVRVCRCPWMSMSRPARCTAANDAMSPETPPFV